MGHYDDQYEEMERETQAQHPSSPNAFEKLEARVTALERGLATEQRDNMELEGQVEADRDDLDKRINRVCELIDDLYNWVAEVEAVAQNLQHQVE